jgi:hypothetical protein
LNTRFGIVSKMGEGIFIELGTLLMFLFSFRHISKSVQFG